MRLENRIAIVTGAAGGIGAASVRRFAQEGAKVTAVDIDGERLEKTVAEVNAEVPGSTTARAADVGKAADIEALVALRRWRSAAASTSSSATPES